MRSTRDSLKYGDLVFLTLDAVEDASLAIDVSNDISISQSSIFLVGADAGSDFKSRTDNISEISQLSVLKSSNRSTFPPSFFSSSIFSIDTSTGMGRGGQPIRYGATIRLVLKTSNQYVSSSATSDDSLKQRHILKLTSKKIDNILAASFVVIPGLSKRKEGDYIYHDDIVFLRDRNGRFWSVQGLPNKRKNQSRPVMLHMGNPSAFKIGFYLSYEECLSNMIVGGDVLQLTHRQSLHNLALTDSTLSTMKHNMTSQRQEIDKKLRAYYNLNIDKNKTNNKTFEVDLQPLPQGDDGKNSNKVDSCFSYWVIESAQDFSFSDMTGKIGWDEPVRLRHLVSGEYLAISDEPNGAVESKKITTKHGNDLLDKSTIFELNSLHDWKLTETKDDDFVFRGHESIIRHRQSQFILGITAISKSISYTMKKGVSEGVVDHSQEEGENSSNTPSELKERLRLSLMSDAHSSDKHSFFISYVSTEHVEKIRLLLAHQHVILQEILLLDAIISSHKSKGKKTKPINQAFEILIDRLTFLLTLFEGGNTEGSGYSSTSTLNQKMFVELGYLEILLKVTRLAEEFLQLGYTDLCNEVMNRGYSLLQELLRENQDNVQRIAQLGGVEQIIAHFLGGFKSPLEEIFAVSESMDMTRVLSRLSVYGLLEKVASVLYGGHIYESDHREEVRKCCDIIRFLSVSCELPDHEGSMYSVSLRELQNWICDAMIYDEGGKRRPLLYTIHIKGSNVGVLVNSFKKYPKASVSSSSAALSGDFRHSVLKGDLDHELKEEKGLDEDEKDADTPYDRWVGIEELKKDQRLNHMWKYGFESVRLLSKLGSYYNSYTQSRIREILPLEVILLALRTLDDKDILKAAFIDVLHHVYIRSFSKSHIFESSDYSLLYWSSSQTSYSNRNGPGDNKDTIFSDILDDYDAAAVEGRDPMRTSPGNDNNTSNGKTSRGVAVERESVKQEYVSTLSDILIEFFNDDLVNDFNHRNELSVMIENIIRMSHFYIEDKSTSLSVSLLQEDDDFTSYPWAVFESMLCLVNSLLKTSFFADPIYTDSISNLNITKIFSFCQLLVTGRPNTKKLFDPTGSSDSFHPSNWNDAFSMIFGNLSETSFSSPKEDLKSKYYEAFECCMRLKVNACEVAVSCVEVMRNKFQRYIWDLFVVGEIQQKFNSKFAVISSTDKRNIHENTEHVMEILHSIVGRENETSHLIKQFAMIYSREVNNIRDGTIDMLQTSLFYNFDPLRGVLLKLVQCGHSLQSDLMEKCMVSVITILPESQVQAEQMFFKTSSLIVSLIPLLSRCSTSLFQIHSSRQATSTAERNFHARVFADFQQLKNILTNEDVKNPGLITMCKQFKLNGYSSNLELWRHYGIPKLFLDFYTRFMKSANPMEGVYDFTFNFNEIQTDVLQAVIRFLLILARYDGDSLHITNTIQESLFISLSTVSMYLNSKDDFRAISDCDQIKIIELITSSLMEDSSSTSHGVSSLYILSASKSLRHSNEDLVAVLFACRKVDKLYDKEGRKINTHIMRILSVLFELNSIDECYLNESEICALVGEVLDAVSNEAFEYAFDILQSLQSLASNNTETTSNLMILKAFHDMITSNTYGIKCLLCLQDSYKSLPESLCELYLQNTGRPTAIKEMKHVIANNLYHNLKDFEILKNRLTRETDLPRGSVLGMHLMFLQCLVSCADIESEEALPLLKKIILIPEENYYDYISVIFRIIFIDKFEVRSVYLQLLRKLLFDAFNSGDLVNQNKIPLLALFKQFAWDIRIIILSLKIEDENNESSESSSRRSWIQDHIQHSVFPFLKDFLGSDFDLKIKEVDEDFARHSKGLTFEEAVPTGELRRKFGCQSPSEDLLLALRFIAMDLSSIKDYDVEIPPKLLEGIADLLNQFLIPKVHVKEEGDRRRPVNHQVLREDHLLALKGSLNFITTFKKLGKDGARRKLKQAVGAITAYKRFKRESEVLSDNESGSKMEYLHFIKLIQGTVLPPYLLGIFFLVEKSSPDTRQTICEFVETKYSRGLVSNWSQSSKNELYFDEFSDLGFYKIISSISDMMLFFISKQYTDEFVKHFQPYLVNKFNNYTNNSNMNNNNNNNNNNSNNKNISNKMYLSSKNDNEDTVNFLNWIRFNGKFFTIFSYFLSNAHEFSKNDWRCFTYWVSVIQRGPIMYQKDMVEERCVAVNKSSMRRIQLHKKEIDRVRFVQNMFSIDFDAVVLIFESIQRIQNNSQQYRSDSQFRKKINAVLGYGIALLETGNRSIQDKIMDLATSTPKQNVQDNDSTQFSDGESNFFLSLRCILRHQDHEVRFHLLEKEEDLTEDLFTEILTVLRFLLLLCEDDNRKNKELFLKQEESETGSVDIVSEVCTLINAISKALIREFQYLSDDSFAKKYGPMIEGIPRKIVCWYQRDSTTGATPSNIIWSESINFHRIHYLSKILECGFNTLNEFAMGGLYDTQIEIIKSGACEGFRHLFEFFGAVQTECTLPETSKIIEDPSLMKLVNFDTAYFTTLFQENSQELYWSGHDPFCIESLYSSYKKNKIRTQQLQQKASKIRSKATRRPSLLLRETSVVTPVKAADNIDPILKELASQKSTYSIYLTKLMEENYNKSHISFSFPSTIYHEIRLLGERFTSMGETQKEPEDSSRSIYPRIHELSEILTDLESSTVSLLSTILEGSEMEDDNNTARALINDVGMDEILANTFNYWQRMIKRLNFAQKFDLDFSHGMEKFIAVHYFALAMRITEFDFGKKHLSRINNWIESENIPINKYIARIEVVGPNKSSNQTNNTNNRKNNSHLIVVYFPIPEVVNKYWHRYEIVLEKYNIVYPGDDSKRSSPEEKLMSYMEDCKKLVLIMKHHDNLRTLLTKYWILKLTVYPLLHYNVWTILTFLLSMGINLYLLMVARINEYGDIALRKVASSSPYDYEDTAHKNPQSPGTTFNSFEILHLFLSAMTFLSMLLVWGVVRVQIGLSGNPHCLLSFESKFMRMLIYPFEYFGLVVSEEKFDSSLTYSWYIRRFFFILYYLFRDLSSLYPILVLLFSLLGLLVSPILYCGCLIQLIAMSKLMTYVINSFTGSFDQVVVTVILAALLIYFFVAWTFLSDTTRNDYTLDGHMDCSSFGSCYRVHLDYGWYSGPEWENAPDTYINPVSESIFNFLYRFIINTIIPSVVSGIIIDRFATQRSMKKSIEDDVLGRCFICNIDREDFEQEGIDFEKHIENDHNMWKYLWFQIYLSEKIQADYSGIESYCSKLISQKEHTKWMPIKKSRDLRKAHVTYSMQSLHENMKGLQSNLEGLRRSNEEVMRLIVGLRNDISKSSKAQSNEDDGSSGLASLSEQIESLRLQLQSMNDTAANSDGRSI